MTRPLRRFTKAEDRAITIARIGGWSLGRIAKRVGRPKSSVQVRLQILAEREEAAYDLGRQQVRRG